MEYRPRRHAGDLTLHDNIPTGLFVVVPIVFRVRP